MTEANCANYCRSLNIKGDLVLAISGIAAMMVIKDGELCDLPSIFIAY